MRTLKFSRVWFAYLAPVIMVASSLLTSCGSENQASRQSDPASSDQTFETQSRVPPRAYYDSLLKERFAVAESGQFTTIQRVYVSFNGGKVNKGFEKGESFLPCVNETTIPSSKINETDQARVLERVAQVFSNAGVRIDLTRSQPSTGDFTTVHVGGQFSQLGCASANSQVVLGLSPIDAKNANPNDVVFVFSGSIRGLNLVAQSIAHEVGHSFGLRNTIESTDVMFEGALTEISKFEEGTVAENSEIQDGPKLMQASLGQGDASIDSKIINSGKPQDLTPTNPLPGGNGSPLPNIPGGIPNLPSLPNLSNLASMIDLLKGLSPTLIDQLRSKIPLLNQLPGNISLQNPQAIMALLALLQNQSQNGGSGLDMSDLLKSLLNQGQGGGSLGGISSLLNMLGMGGLGGGLNAGPMIDKLLPLVLPFLSPGQNGSPNANPIDLGALLGIQGLTQPADLISLIQPLAQLIQANSSGGNSQALLDLLKMAIVDQYN
jgi:hypothetical protein